MGRYLNEKLLNDNNLLNNETVNIHFFDKLKGGDTLDNVTNGEGGYSFVDRNRAVPGLFKIHAAMHSGSGQVIIIPAIEVHSQTQCNFRVI